MSKYAPVLFQLGSPGMPVKWIQQHYGIDLTNRDTRSFIESIIKQAGIRYRSWNSEVVDRFALELALQKMGLQSLRFAAIDYGMNEESLRNTLIGLADKGLARVTDQALLTTLVETKLLRKTIYLFPEIDKKTYVTRNGLCNAVHMCIKKHLNVNITPVYCSASVCLSENVTEFASDFDVITQEPIGISHRVWLDFHKPLSLAPDYCTPQTAVAVRALQDHVIGGYDMSRYSADQIEILSRQIKDV